MFDVVALGELLIDFVCQSKNDAGYPTLAANPGGAPGNFLAALQAYGCTTAMLSKVGTDALGKLLVGTLENLGIHTRGIVMADDVFTTLAFVTLDNTGNREFSFARKPGADTRLTQAEVLSSGLIDDCRVFHFGTLSLTDEPVRTATCAAVARAKAQGKLISLDPNLRKPLWSSENEARRQIEWSLSQADIVKISDEEIDFLWGISPKSIHVVDTTGAGDIFGGSAMSRFLLLNKRPEELSVSEMTEIVRFACCAASLSTQIHGGISSVIPMEQVLACVEKTYKAR